MSEEEEEREKWLEWRKGRQRRRRKYKQRLWEKEGKNEGMKGRSQGE